MRHEQICSVREIDDQSRTTMIEEEAAGRDFIRKGEESCVYRSALSNGLILVDNLMERQPLCFL
jgi:hypothetical protein